MPASPSVYLAEDVAFISIIDAIAIRPNEDVVSHYPIHSTHRLLLTPIEVRNVREGNAVGEHAPEIPGNPKRTTLRSSP